MRTLFEQWAGEQCEKVVQLTPSGSNRRYILLVGEHRRCIATVNANVEENEAFFSFASQLASRGVRVPEVYAVSADRTSYLQQDLGDTTIYSYLVSRKASGVDTLEDMRRLYTRAVDDLYHMQTVLSDLDYTKAYPRARFDRQALMWDLNYFKYYFLKMVYAPFNEDDLERDFSALADYLLQDCPWQFVYRDFQSRNIMVGPSEELFYIDFQGCRMGAPQYDLASLLFSGGAAVSSALRAELLEHYLDLRFGGIESDIPSERQQDRRRFEQKFYGYALIRILQALGAYGYRGYFERKELFIKSVPTALSNLTSLLQTHPLPVELPALNAVLRYVCEHDEMVVEEGKLSVKVFSFSYKRGAPIDRSGNGGGFVFDCRALPNPGRDAIMMGLTGRHTEVKEFLDSIPEVDCFFDNCASLVRQSVLNYTERGFTSLVVCFGCTGGRHRSVYMAERMAAYLKAHFSCRVVLRHMEQNYW